MKLVHDGISKGLLRLAPANEGTVPFTLHVYRMLSSVVALVVSSQGPSASLNWQEYISPERGGGRDGVTVTFT